MKVYYNEIDPYCIAWLQNLMLVGLIPDGEIDGRSIANVQADDLQNFGQCHFFAGLGGWLRAFNLSLWPPEREVWSGSCPCQPFSLAGKQKGFADDRHLWPIWRKLIAERRPSVVFGEQVASASQWLALVRSDLEALGYAVGAMPIEAASAGANHRRNRYWFVADAHESSSRQRWKQRSREQCRARSDQEEDIDVSNRNSTRLALGQEQSTWQERAPAERSGSALADAAQQQHGSRPTRMDGWPEHSDSRWWSVEPDVGRLAHGIPARVGKLRALGNAIVPQIAAEFISAYLECRP